jgi:hypothetical protein
MCHYSVNRSPSFGPSTPCDGSYGPGLSLSRRFTLPAAISSSATASADGLYISKSGWILLALLNALARMAFDALNDPSVERTLSL